MVAIWNPSSSPKSEAAHPSFSNTCKIKSDSNARSKGGEFIDIAVKDKVQAELFGVENNVAEEDEFEGTTQVTFDSGSVWRPDIMLYNT